jgi:hypothetical protein
MRSTSRVPAFPGYINLIPRHRYSVWCKQRIVILRLNARRLAKGGPRS